MVYCAAVDCKSDSGKDRHISFFRLPKESKYRKIWLQKLKGNNLPKEENIYAFVICTSKILAIKET